MKLFRWLRFAVSVWWYERTHPEADVETIRHPTRRTLGDTDYE